MKQIRLFLLAALLLSAISSWAHDFEVDGICYNITSETDKTVEITYKGSSYTSAKTYTGFVVIPPSVTYHGTKYSVTTIGKYAFYLNEISRIIISNSVTTIGDLSFSNCYGLTSVTIPNSVTVIGERAFSDCYGLTSVTIPNSVTVIGERAFSGSDNLVSICVDKGNAIYDSRDNCNAIIRTSTNDLVMGCKNTVIPGSVTSIGYEAFSFCEGLTSIVIPNSVKSIGESAFSGCSGLTSVTIPNSVISIGSSAFEGCSGLTSIIIPNGVVSIGSFAFSRCSSLTSVSVDKGNSYYDSRDNCNALIETSTNTLIAGCKNTVIPNGVVSIGSSAFYGCSGLTSIIIPNGVVSIGSSAFYGCTGLTSIIIPNGVVTIDNYAFYGCTGLTSFVIPNGVISINDGTFSGCSGLSSVTIPNSVTVIGERAFTNCKALTSVTIPNGVTSIGYGSFSACSRLTSVNISNSVTVIDGFAFSSCSKLSSITIPEGVTSIGRYAFKGCSDLSSVTNLALQPQVISYDCFSTYGTLHVIKGTKNAYVKADCWNLFKIVEDVEPPKATFFDVKSEWIRIDTYKTYDIPEYSINTPAYELEISSSDENIVTVDPVSNQFVGLQEGVAVITVNVKGTDLKDTFMVYVGGATPEDPVIPTPPIIQCAAPTIEIINGEIFLGCETAGAEIKYVYSRPAENVSGTGDKVALQSSTFTISAYATAVGYTDSETVTKNFTLTQSDVKGDMNGDGKVDMQDANIIVNQYLGK